MNHSILYKIPNVEVDILQAFIKSSVSLLFKFRVLVICFFPQRSFTSLVQELEQEGKGPPDLPNILRRIKDGEWTTPPISHMGYFRSLNVEQYNFWKFQCNAHQFAALRWHNMDF